MSTGLLHGLAARALGVAQPLRAQRSPTFGPGVDDGAGDEVVATGATPQRDAAAPGRDPAQSGQAPVATAAPRSTAPSATADRPKAAATQLSPARSGADPGAGAGRETVAALVERRHPAAAVTSIEPARHAPSSESARRPPAPPSLPADPSAPNPAPAPLMPLQPPATRPATGAAAPASRRQAPAAPANSTEVHVSIGRVELTALAPTVPPRTATRREAADGRSLADYLRGTGSPGSKRPA